MREDDALKVIMCQFNLCSNIQDAIRLIFNCIFPGVLLREL